MKKIIALLLAMTMLSGLAACGSTKEEKAGEETSQTETNAAEGSDKNAGENVDKETITIKAMNESQEMADIKVPFNLKKSQFWTWLPLIFSIQSVWETELLEVQQFPLNI